MERFFKVASKGLKGKHQTPFILLVNADGEKVELHLEGKQQLGEFEIDQEFLVKLGDGGQTKLAPK